jgi:hypothetical protein
MASAKDVAEYMLQYLTKERYLYQEVIVYKIKNDFGDEFVYINQNGNLAIDRRVLTEFRKLTEGTVVWERGQRVWRKRESYDPPNRRQAD